MSSSSPNFVGNDSAQDQLAGLSVAGLSRVVEIPYTSTPIGVFVGNFTPVAVLTMSLGTGSRIVEIAYTSALGN